jgi:hypothetical protein
MDQQSAYPYVEMLEAFDLPSSVDSYQYQAVHSNIDI